MPQLALAHYRTDDIPEHAWLGVSVAAMILLIMLGLVMLISLGFWLMMLIHAVKNNIADKPVWILILLVSFFFGMWLIGALVYYFVVKKTYRPARPAGPKSRSPKPKA